jgi:hypothetical protein
LAPSEGSSEVVGGSGDFVPQHTRPCCRHTNHVVHPRHHRAERGVALRFNRQDLPCFTVWKNTGALEDGYVTGLEPATNGGETRMRTALRRLAPAHAGLRKTTKYARRDSKRSAHPICPATCYSKRPKRALRNPVQSVTIRTLPAWSKRGQRYRPMFAGESWICCRESIPGPQGLAGASCLAKRLQPPPRPLRASWRNG